jgi:predicted nuclease with TOPRIM domain
MDPVEVKQFQQQNMDLQAKFDRKNAEVYALQEKIKEWEETETIMESFRIANVRDTNHQLALKDKQIRSLESRLKTRDNDGDINALNSVAACEQKKLELETVMKKIDARKVIRYSFRSIFAKINTLSRKLSDLKNY